MTTLGTSRQRAPLATTFEVYQLATSRSCYTYVETSSHTQAQVKQFSHVNKRRSKGPGVEFKLRDMGHVFHVNISKCSFPTHMSRPAFTRPSNKAFISFKERLLYGVISPPKFKVCFRCSSLSFNHATFEFYNSTLLLEMRHWSFTMTHRSSDIQHSSFNIQHSSLFQHSSFKLNFTDEWLTF